jgi:hypothetical protein
VERNKREMVGQRETEDRFSYFRGFSLFVIRNRKQRIDVGKYSFVDRTITSWNQLPAGLLESISMQTK